MKVAVVKEWKKADTLAQAKDLLEQGYVLKWNEAKRLATKLSANDYRALIEFSATKLGERYEQHLSMEILVETQLLLIHVRDYNLTYQLIGNIIDLDQYDAAVPALIRTIFRLELTNQQLHDELFALGALLISELGISLWQFSQQFPEEQSKVDPCIRDIVTHLQSVANENNPCIRLCLLRFFGVFNALPQFQQNFNKILSRFAHTVLEQLFVEFFSKKNEDLAQEFLLDNLPYIFEANLTNQQIMHNIFRQFFLKFPDRFVYFYKILSLHLMKSENERHALAAPQFLEHTVALFALAIELNHRTLVKEFAQIVNAITTHFQVEDKMISLVSQIKPRRAYRQTVEQILASANLKPLPELKVAIPLKVEGKRGRKKTAEKQLEISSSLLQVTRLGASILKAS